jgi:hypothetical protein
MDGVDLDRAVGNLGCVEDGASRSMNGIDLGQAVGSLGCVSEGAVGSMNGVDLGLAFGSFCCISEGTSGSINIWGRVGTQRVPKVGRTKCGNSTPPP